MAKKSNKKKTVSTSKAQTKPVASPVRSTAHSEDKSQGAPRGTVSTKPIGRMRTFFREVRVEMTKVTWPTRKELAKSTGVVIVAVAVAGLFIWGFDNLWTLIIKSVGMGG